jgi:hypothetical protein
MSTNSEVAIEESDKESDMVVKTELHAKCVTPRRLSKELKELVGHDAELKVEVIPSRSCRSTPTNSIKHF